MTDGLENTTETAADPKARLIEAALMHVPFDGWSEASFRAASVDAGLTAAEARALFRAGRWTWRWPFTRRAMRRWSRR